MATLFLLLIYLAFISLGLPDSLLGSAWPVMRLDFGAPLDAAGLVSIVVTAGTVLSALTSERLVKRFGTGPVTAVSVLLTAAALVLMAFGQSIAWMLLLAVPLGLGAGAVDAALNNYVALHYAPRHMSWLHCFWGVGAFIGPLIMGGFLRQGGNWRGGYLTIGVIQCVVCLLLFLSLPLWGRQRSLAPPGSAGAPTTGGADNDGSASASGGDRAGGVHTAGQAPSRARDVIATPGVKAALVTFLFYCGLEYTVGLWGASFLAGARGFTAPDAATAIALYYGGITAGRALSGFLTLRFTGSQLIRAGLVVITGGAALLALPLGGGVALTALLLIGFGCAPIYPSMIHETPGRFGAASSQKIIGWQMAAAYTGSTLLPPLVGLVSANTSITVVPFALLAFCLVMLGFSESINRAASARGNKTNEVST